MQLPSSPCRLRRSPARRAPRRTISCCQTSGEPEADEVNIPALDRLQDKICSGWLTTEYLDQSTRIIISWDVSVALTKKPHLEREMRLSYGSTKGALRLDVLLGDGLRAPPRQQAPRRPWRRPRRPWRRSRGALRLLAALASRSALRFASSSATLAAAMAAFWRPRARRRRPWRNRSGQRSAGRVRRCR